MTWTPPRFGTVGDTFTAPWYNAEVRDNFLWVPRPLVPPITTEKDVVSSTTPTDLLLPTGLTIPGASIGANGALRCFLCGDYKNQTGATKTLTLSIVLGATTLWSDTTAGIASSAAGRHEWIMEFTIANCGAQNSNYMTGVWYMSTAAGAVTGIGDLAVTASGTDGPAIVPFGTNGKTAVDTSANQTLTVVATHSAIDANLSIRREYATFELIGQGA
jgi:hypothetical protein